MEKVQHEKIATRKKCNMKRLQLKKSAIWIKCNTKSSKHKKIKKFNMKKV